MMTSRAPAGGLVQYIVGLLSFVVFDSLQTGVDRRKYHYQLKRRTFRCGF